jgi:nucleoside 2-deoxyribosyltransferase
MERIGDWKRAAPNWSSEGILYLAAPYTHPDVEIRRQRVKIVNAAAARIIRLGRIVFSPLTMTHPLDVLLAGKNETLGSDYWVKFDEAFMEFCSDIAVLCLDGWKESSGVAREIRFFLDRKRPVHYLEFDGVDLRQSKSRQFEIAESK